jgi:hypothetical protein
MGSGADHHHFCGRLFCTEEVQILRNSSEKSQQEISLGIVISLGFSSQRSAVSSQLSALSSQPSAVSRQPSTCGKAA